MSGVQYLFLAITLFCLLLGGVAMSICASESNYRWDWQHTVAIILYSLFAILVFLGLIGVFG